MKRTYNKGAGVKKKENRTYNKNIKEVSKSPKKKKAK